jgi:hypothetical protein
MTASRLLEIVEATLHANRNEWIFLRELRVGSGRGGGRQSLQRVDGFALNCYPHKALRRICYEVKLSRADFLGELRQPLKRRIGMRYSNEFYFVTPAGLVEPEEIPAGCGLIEAGEGDVAEWRESLARQDGFFHYDPLARAYCVLVLPAPWRDTPGPTWELMAAMLRHQRRLLEEAQGRSAEQAKLEFE